MFDMGLSSALTFFAPRRMGKTEFLRKDIMPYACQHGWDVHYFSFLDAQAQPEEKYKRSLLQFALETGCIKGQARKSRIKRLKGAVAGISAEIEMRDKDNQDNVYGLNDLVCMIAAHKRSILLLDEVQALASHPANDQFIASLRTALDTNKDRIKVIFTGSSREKLTHMFSKASAPFFHFGQNLDFPCLGKEFSDHLAAIFQQVTQRELDRDKLWQAFQEMDYVPQLVRSLVERLALNPNLTVDLGKKQLLADLYHDRSYADIWQKLSQLEKLVLREIAAGDAALYAEGTVKKLSSQLGLDDLKKSSVQSTLRSLTRKDLVIKSIIKDNYVVDDPNFCSWLETVE
jgi:ATP:corrinoid adenosyltransferase